MSKVVEVIWSTPTLKKKRTQLLAGCRRAQNRGARKRTVSFQSVWCRGTARNSKKELAGSEMKISV